MSAKPILQKLKRPFPALFLITLLLLVVLATGLFVLLGTSGGNRWLLSNMSRVEPRLSVTLESGTLLDGVRLTDLRWSSPGIELLIPQLEWRWDWHCLRSGTLCLDRLWAHGGRLILTENPGTDPAEERADAGFQLPVAVVVRQLQLEQTSVAAYGHQIVLDNLELNARLDATGLKISQALLQELQIDITAASAVAAIPAEKDPRQVPLNLPRIHIPLAIQLDSVDLQQAHIRQAGAEQLIQRLQLTAKMTGADLEVSRCELSAPQASLQLQGQVRLAEGYPLSLEARAKLLDFPPLNGLAVELSAGGSIADLTARVTTSGPVTGQLHTSLQPLDPKLPFSARLTWQQLNWPFETPAVSSETGQLDIRGSLESYSFDLAGKASTEQLPALALVARGRGGGQQLQLDSVDLELLEGTAKINGLLRWDEALSWQGQLAFQQLNPAELVSSLPGQLSGQLDSQLTLRNGHWDLYLEPLELNGALAGRVLSVSNGQVRSRGSLEDYHFQLSMTVDGEPLPALALAVEGQGDARQLSLDALTLKTLAGEAELKGDLRWGEEIAWQGNLDFQHLNPAELLPELPGQLSGRLGSEFRLRNGQWNLSLQQIAVTGELAGQPLHLQGSVQGNQAGDWQISQLQLQSGDNRLQANGHIGAESDLKGELLVIDLRQSVPLTTGAASGEFSLNGARDGLRLQLSLAAESLSYAEQKIDSLNISAQLDFSAAPQGSVSVQAEGLAYKALLFKQLNATFSGDSAAHSLQLDLQEERFSLQSSLKGELLEKLWSGQLQTSVLETPLGRWSLAGPLDLNYDLDQYSVLIDKHCWVSATARLCLDEDAPVGRRGQLAVSLRELSSEQLAGLLPEGFTWQGSLSADAAASWSPEQKPLVDVELNAVNGRFEVVQDGQKLQADYQQLQVTAALDEKTAQGTLVLRSEQLGQGDIALQLTSFEEEQPIQGEFQLANLQLNILGPLLTTLKEISGTVTAEGKISGPLKHPQLFGTAQLRDGRLGDVPWLADIEQINLQLNLDGDQAHLDGELLLGEGRAELAGAASWQQTPVTGWLTLKGERHQFRLEPQLNLLFSPDLRLELQPEQLLLSGQIMVPYGRLKVRKLPPDAVRLSEDVVVLDDPSVARRSQGLAFAMALDVTLLDDVKIDAFGLKADLEGELMISQSPTQPLSGTGRIDLHDGTYRAFGQDLLINKGVLLFSGPLSKPYLDVDAIRNPISTSDDVTAGIRLQGEAKKPKVSIYSEPSMSQQEALAYLLHGRSLSSSSDTGHDATAASMLISAGMGGSEGTISQLGEAFGVKDLAVDTRGEGDDAKVNIRGYLLPGVQIGYGVGIFSPVSEITLRYEVLPKLVLEAVSGLRSAIDLLYEFEF